jgi:UDP-N-acetylmuramate dehydrogenase
MTTYFTPKFLAHHTFETNVPAKKLTTFGVGSPVPYVVSLGSKSELIEFQKECSDTQINPIYLGFGSNSILPDELFPVPLVRLNKEFDFIHYEQKDDKKCILSVGAGTSLMNLSRVLSSEGYTGLEFAAGIPASIGGAIIMNAGAHGKSIEDILISVDLLLPEGKVERFNKDDLQLSYRHIDLPLGSIVVSANFSLDADDRDKILSERKKHLSYRKLTQPLQLPSAGSVFRNPYLSSAVPKDVGERTPQMMSAGELLEKVGLKGEKLGGVMFSELHANWLVRFEEVARADDVKKLVQEGQRRVFEQFGVELIPELHYL